MLINNGVYEIRHLVSGKRYIGSCAEYRGIRYRWLRHKRDLNFQQHHSIKLQRAWNKYGEDAFVFEILECCESPKCIEREQHYLDTLLFANCHDSRFNELGYNICRVVGSRLGTNQSDDTREKIRCSKNRKT